MINGKSILPRITSKMEVLPMVTITPHMAEELLTLNNTNRHISKYDWDQYFQDMTNDNWHFTGQTIKISKDMELQDGQHTLLACSESGKTIVLNIQTGLEPEAFNYMDIGRKRNGSDVLQLKGFHNYHVMSAAIKTIILYQTKGRIETKTRSNLVPNQQIADWTNRKADTKLLIECIEQTIRYTGKGKFKFLSHSNWAVVCFLLSKIDREQATEFVQMLSSGQDISMRRHAPVYLLREKMLTFTDDNIGLLRRGGRIATEIKMRYIFRGWNAWRTKEKITKLVIDSKEPKMEKLL